MLNIPESEKQTFEALLLGQASQAGMAPADYVRKVWYHEQAARLGEYVAMSLSRQLLPFAAHSVESLETSPEAQVIVFSSE